MIQFQTFTVVAVSGRYVIDNVTVVNFVYAVSPSKNEFMINVVSALRPMDCRIPGIPAFNSSHSGFHLFSHRSALAEVSLKIMYV